MTASVLIIGLGQIGFGYDSALDPKTYVLTHARAFHQHPAFDLRGAVDPDEMRRRQFEDLYGARAFPDIASGLNATRPDVVAIASPTPVHAESLRTVLETAAPSAILCEKPLSADIASAREMVAACARRGCRLYVNYIRRSEPGASEVQRRILSGAVGTPAKGVTWYSKGLFNNGSHFVNLLQCWLGNVRRSRLITAGRTWADTDDPEPDFIIEFERGEVHFLAAREELFSHCTIELVATNGRLRYDQGGEVISWQPATPDLMFPGYTVLASVAEGIDTSFKRAQWHVTDQLAASLAGRPARICTGEEALQTLESIHSLRSDV